MSFSYPFILILIPLIFFAGYYAKNKRRSFCFRFPSIKLLPPPGVLRPFLASNLVYMRSAALSLLVLASARPQTPIEDSLIKSNAVDMVLAVDLSESMRALDMSSDNKMKSRIDAVKEVLPDFIQARKNDRIGMVIFATKAFIASPLTLNRSFLLNRVKGLEIGMIDGRHTSIGLGLTASLNRVKNSKARSKIIILLTDGRNNAGDVSPDVAANIARALDIKIYTIGAGSSGYAPFPILDESGNITGYDSIKADIDESLLVRIAEITQGRYFRVTDFLSLKTVYREIDAMEKSYIEEKTYEDYNELFGWFLCAGLFLLLLEIIAANTYLRKIP